MARRKPGVSELLHQWNQGREGGIAKQGWNLAADVREYHIPDFSNWKGHDSFEKAFEELVRDLRKGEGLAEDTWRAKSEVRVQKAEVKMQSAKCKCQIAEAGGRRGMRSEDGGWRRGGGERSA